MKKVKKFIFVITLLIIVSGCSNSSKTSSEPLEQVKDEVIINIIKNQVSSLEYLETTKKGYEKGTLSINDYNNTDKILYGLEYRIAQGALQTLNKEQLIEAQKLGVKDANEFINVSEVEKYINKTFGAISVNHETINKCPAFYYNKDNKLYYIINNCKSEKTSEIVSYIDDITKKGNEFYATVYAGLIDNENNQVYGNFEKTKIIEQIDEKKSFEINQENKKEFTEFTYTFIKNSDGNYVFSKIQKVK